MHLPPILRNVTVAIRPGLLASLVVVRAALLPSCGNGSPTSGSPSPCPAAPTGQSQVLPLFQRPFRGDFALGAFFDHDLPITFDRSADNNGFVLTFCGERVGGVDGHPGYDWTLPQGTPLLAVADGEVVLAGEAPPQYCPPLGRITTGLIVLLRHQAPSGEGFVSLLAHMSRVDVRTGDRVSGGQQVGLSGSTGCSGGPHLHFEAGRVRGSRNVQIDPYGWSGQGVDPWAVHRDGAESVWLWKPGEAPSLRW